MFSWADTSTFYAKLQTAVYFYRPRYKPLKTRVYNGNIDRPFPFHSTHGTAEIIRYKAQDFTFGLNIEFSSIVLSNAFSIRI